MAGPNKVIVIIYLLIAEHFLMKKCRYICIMAFLLELSGI